MRACRPTKESPISPSISARGVSAATESITTISIAPRAHKRFCNVQTLLTGVRLGDQQAVNVNAECLGVNRVERVLGVDKRSRAAQLLRLCNAVQRNRGLTGGFRSVDLNDSAARQTADAEREIQTDRASRDVFDVHAGVFAQTHDRAFAELLFDLTERSGKCFLLISRRSDRFQLLFW